MYMYVWSESYVDLFYVCLCMMIMYIFPVLTPLFLSLMDGWDLLREQSRDGDQTLHDQSRSTRARMEQLFVV